MRRKDREITDIGRIVDIIDSCDVLRLGLSDGDFPYIVPVNFAYTVKDGKLAFYIHGAAAGRKYELLTKNPLCSFETDVPLGLDVNAEEKYVTMRYRSVMGRASVEMLSGDEKRRALYEILMARYEATRNFACSESSLDAAAVFRLNVLEVTAKENVK